MSSPTDGTWKHHLESVRRTGRRPLEVSILLALPRPQTSPPPETAPPVLRPLESCPPPLFAPCSLENKRILRNAAKAISMADLCIASQPEIIKNPCRQGYKIRYLALCVSVNPGPPPASGNITGAIKLDLE